MPTTDDAPDWDAVIAKALAYLCLHYGDLTKKSMVDQADFLTRFGIPRKEAALILGTTDDSLSAMYRQRKAAKKAARKKAVR
jgi:hypothetical protein